MDSKRAAGEVSPPSRCLLTAVNNSTNGANGALYNGNTQLRRMANDLFRALNQNRRDGVLFR